MQEWAREHPEHLEGKIETMMHDLHVAMDFIAQLTQLVYHGDCDEKYDD